MKRVTVAEVESANVAERVDCRTLSDALGTTDLAVNHYRIRPGEEFPAGLHAHGDQEEVFVVLSGEATFETLDSDRTEGGEIAVGDGETIRFAPGEYQSGRNDGKVDLVALALGAPPDSEDVRVPLDCPECGHDFLHPEAPEQSDAGVLLVCPDCGVENVPEDCPDCGEEMQVALGDSGDGSETVVVCPDCGVETGSPFE